MSSDVDLSQLIANVTSSEVTPIVNRRALSGGSIHRVERVELADGRRYCIKRNVDAGDMFAQEAYGLAALAQVGQLRTPKVIALGTLTSQDSKTNSSIEQCLILEMIEGGQANDDCWEDLGVRLAEHHRLSLGHQFGWSSDNYIGSTIQLNESRDSWLEFFRDCRLSYQLKLARQRGLGSAEFYRLAGRLLERLDDWLPSKSQPSLLHGDLWNGNVLVGSDGLAVVIDPAVYYGDREAELAMPLLFGGFPRSFLEAYQEVWPLYIDWQDRVELYQLYHLLNHLNLFGTGYLDSCLEILERYGS